MKKKKVFTPKDPKKRAKGAIVGISVHLATVAAMALLTMINLSKLLGLKGGDPVGDIAPGFEPFVLAYGLAAMLYLLTLVPYLVLFLMWVHRANRNARTLSKGMEVSPGWNVGWFFVPFASVPGPGPDLAGQHRSHRLERAGRPDAAALVVGLLPDRQHHRLTVQHGEQDHDRRRPDGGRGDHDHLLRLVPGRRRAGDPDDPPGHRPAGLGLERGRLHLTA
jgi:hypothetical protein